jgi:hypothetical protein
LGKKNPIIQEICYFLESLLITKEDNYNYMYTKENGIYITNSLIISVIFWVSSKISLPIFGEDDSNNIWA